MDIEKDIVRITTKERLEFYKKAKKKDLVHTIGGLLSANKKLTNNNGEIRYLIRNQKIRIKKIMKQLQYILDAPTAVHSENQRTKTHSISTMKRAYSNQKFQNSG